VKRHMKRVTRDVSGGRGARPARSY
jgi:hypothetical protein